MNTRMVLFAGKWSK